MRALQHLSNLGNNGFSDLSLLYCKGTPTQATFWQMEQHQRMCRNC